MSLDGYTDYQRREFCKSIQCIVQTRLDAEPEGSEAYDGVRETCKNGCIHSTYEFHHWLIEKGYLIVRKTEG